MPETQVDYLIIGAGIIGLALARRLGERKPGARIALIDKEADVALHASGRNSGVLHAGFYYKADSLKARLTVAGNRALREYCEKHGLPVNACGKLVVARNVQELEKLHELERRGKVNGSTVELIDEGRASELEPNVKTFKKALYSPETATIDPVSICRRMKEELISRGVQFRFNSAYLAHKGQVVETQSGEIEARLTVNCAGLYADKIAQDYGFGRQYTIMPFKGLYLKYTANKSDVRMNIYPVPDLKFPFLGVHFTKTVDGGIKIGPTAIPALWRENYSLFSSFRAGEFARIAYDQGRLFITNAFNFRDLAFEEMKKYWKRYFIGLAASMVRHIDTDGFGEFTRPGIRAQLLNRKTLELVQDFVVEGDAHSVHVLNAVSPAFTCSLPFADYLIENYITH